MLDFHSGVRGIRKYSWNAVGFRSFWIADVYDKYSNPPPTNICRFDIHKFATCDMFTCFISYVSSAFILFHVCLFWQYSFHIFIYIYLVYIWYFMCFDFVCFNVFLTKSMVLWDNIFQSLLMYVLLQLCPKFLLVFQLLWSWCSCKWLHKLKYLWHAGLTIMQSFP